MDGKTSTQPRDSDDKSSTPLPQEESAEQVEPSSASAGGDSGGPYSPATVRGDPPASDLSEDLLGDIYERFKGPLFRLACGLVNDPSIAAELLHDTFARMLKSDVCNSLTNAEDLETAQKIAWSWLWQAVRKVCQNHINLIVRRRRIRRRINNGATYPREKHGPDTQSEQLLAEERRQIINESIQELDDQIQQVICLTHGLCGHKELTTAEISELLGITCERVYQLKYRGQRQLRDKLLEKGVTYPP